MLSRRDFNKLAASALAASAVPSTLLAKPAAIPEGSYLDFHARLGQVWGARPALSAGELVHWMNERGIAMAVVHPLESPEAWDHPIPTDYVLEQTATYRHRLIPAAVVDPRVLNLRLGDENSVPTLLERYIDYGARVFGEHKPGIPIADDRNLELFASVDEVGLPVLLSMDERRNADEAGLPGLEMVLKAYPDLPFVVGGPSFWDGFGGAAPSGRETPAVVRLMSEYSNLYANLGGASGAEALLRDADASRTFLTDFQERMIWSSGITAPGQQIAQLELFNRLDLPEDVRSSIFLENARALLGI